MSAQAIPQDSQSLLLIRLGIEGLQQRPAPLGSRGCGEGAGAEWLSAFR
jgi:hypothetical protein